MTSALLFWDAGNGQKEMSPSQICWQLGQRLLDFVDSARDHQAYVSTKNGLLVWRSGATKKVGCSTDISGARHLTQERDGGRTAFIGHTRNHPVVCGERQQPIPRQSITFASNLAEEFGNDRCAIEFSHMALLGKKLTHSTLGDRHGQK